MKRLSALSLTLALAMLPAPLPAQEDVPQESESTDGEMRKGFDLIEEGSKLLLRGLTDRFEPMMDELASEMEPKLRAFARDFGPMMEKFSDLIGDLDDYEPPEKLPNGDIILRRKTPLEQAPPADGEIDI